MFLVGRMRVPASEAELAYVDVFGDVWLVDVAGRSPRKLVPAGRCPSPVALQWSPDKDRLACHGDREPDKNGVADQVVVVADVRGRIVLELRDVTGFAWSRRGYLTFGATRLAVPTGQVIPFVVLRPDGGTQYRFKAVDDSVAWSPDGTRLAYTDGAGRAVILDVERREERKLGSGIGLILGWVRDGEALLVGTALNRAAGMYYAFEAQILDVPTGRTQRVPSLDDETPYWMSSDGTYAVFYQRFDDSDPASLRILDFRSLAVTPIKGSRISVAGDAGPTGDVIIAPDGRFVYTTYLSEQGTTDIFRARRDGTGWARVGGVGSSNVVISGDLSRLAFLIEGKRPALGVAAIDGNQAHAIEGASPPFVPLTLAWRR